MKVKDFAQSGHPPTLFSAFMYFDVSFMVWVLIGVLACTSPRTMDFRPPKRV